MAIGETHLTVVGNVCSELNRKTLASGDEVVSFWLRSNERRFDKESGGWTDGRHFSIRVTCWRRIADTVAASLSKGDPVIVNGRLYTNRYEAEGQPRSIPELEALAIGPNLARCSASVRRASRGTRSGSPSCDRPGEVGPTGGDQTGTGQRVTAA